MHELFDPQRHEALSAQAWSPEQAREAIAHICAAAQAEFDDTSGSWLLHPQDDPPQPGARSFNLYWGATGAVWALRHLADEGAVPLSRDYTPWIAQYPQRLREEAAHEQHGSASYLFGESAALLLAWQTTRRDDLADRLHAVVQGNQHNTAQEPLWGNAGTVLAAIRMAEEPGADGRWAQLVASSIEALHDAMIVDPEIGTWIWEQDLYGRRARYLGGGHGLAGNAYAAWRAAAFADPKQVQTIEQRALETLSRTALRATQDTADGTIALLNWHVLVNQDLLESWRAKGGKALVQDCHGAPGVVCRFATAPRNAAWDELLRGAGELTWHAGPLAKGPSLCHGTAGSALACLKLWRRFADPLWLERARLLAMHAAAQVEAARSRHGQGRHSLWTGDLGVACVLWECVAGNDRFPTLDHF
jgi:hypothetical protein